MTRIEEFAPAKVNLTLHITGQRADGYHLLDSLVVFADVGDRISVMPAVATTLEVSGPRAAGVPTGSGNLVLKAAAALGGAPAAIELDKHLPAASGIGGGSADAAATLRALSRLWGMPLLAPEVALRLGADVPVCLIGRPTRMGGIGEVLAPVPMFPALPAVLVNPGIEVPTPAVFRDLDRKDGTAMADIPEGLASVADAATWLATQRNDLEPPAHRIAPIITDVIASLEEQPDCLLARMSGSGATCFGLFPDSVAAQAAAAALSRSHPEWWISPVTLSASPG